MFAPGIIAAMSVSCLAAMGTVANEATHGGVAETMGFGHHHLADYGGYHCASHNGPHAEQHLQHMHNETHAAHGGCAGGARMHGNPMGGP